MSLDSRLLEILACPVDRQGLWYFADEDTLYNPRLQRSYRIHEGIPVMLPLPCMPGPGPINLWL